MGGVYHLDFHGIQNNTECLFDAGKAFIGTRGTLEVYAFKAVMQGTKF